ncbi:MAG: hypothetical protein ACOYXT_11840 [Bacteroidota bacterium]
MQNLLIGLFVIFLLSCEQKVREASNVNRDSISNDTLEEPNLSDNHSLETKIFPLDSVLELNCRKYKNHEGEYEFGGVNIIDRQTEIVI